VPLYLNSGVPSAGKVPPVDDARTSWFAILLVLATEIITAALLAAVVAQAYIAYECSHDVYRAEHRAQCDGGLPYPPF
jgi:hypothetical protein